MRRTDRSSPTEDAIDLDLDRHSIGPVARVAVALGVPGQGRRDPLRIRDQLDLSLEREPAATVDLAHGSPPATGRVARLLRVAERDHSHQPSAGVVREADRDDVWRTV